MSEQGIHGFTALGFSQGLMPVLFVGHGSPLNAIEDNAFSASWRALGEVLPTPTAILCVSAHWLTRGTAVTSMARPRTIHDFYGFPEPLNRFQYPASGDPALAVEIAERIEEEVRGTTVVLDEDWGLDHGTWVVLARMYPSAECPVLQLSIDAAQPAAYHYGLGQALAALRRCGVLVMGSGNIVHNLGLVDPSAGSYPWAEAFDGRVAELLVRGDHEPIVNYEVHGQAARLAVPTNDHYLPLVYVVGAQDPQDRVAFFSERIVYGSISMRCVLFY
jgi:4,5-DOPA dioxygenase extradiol